MIDNMEAADRMKGLIEDMTKASGEVSELRFSQLHDGQLAILDQVKRINGLVRKHDAAIAVVAQQITDRDKILNNFGGDIQTLRERINSIGVLNGIGSLIAGIIAWIK